MKKNKIRYAVVGLGHIAQTAVLPAFAHAKKNSELVALISEDPKKLKELSKHYGTEFNYLLENIDDCLKSGNIDALYIATPNTEHQDIAERAMDLGIHVLCEKPLTPTEQACRSLIEARNDSGVKCMVAYRLHFERANLKAGEIARSGRIGELRYFNSCFSYQVTDRKNIRLDAKVAGGPLYDIGVYCINAARSIFRQEPLEVIAFAANKPGDKRFSDVEEMISVTMRFPEDKLATFTCSFGAGVMSHYEVVGTKGSLCLESAYEYTEPMTLTVTVNEKDRVTEYAKRDQFAPELIYFSDCILENRKPEPSLEEGLADIAVVEAIQESVRTGSAVAVQAPRKTKRPSMKQEMKRKAIQRPPPLVHATPAGSN